MRNNRKLARLFSALSDETRIKILEMLYKGELNVNQIREEIGTTLPAISYQLKILTSEELLKFDKRGRKKYFRLADDHVKQIIKAGLDHIKEGKLEDKIASLQFN